MMELLQNVSSLRTRSLPVSAVFKLPNQHRAPPHSSRGGGLSSSRRPSKGLACGGGGGLGSSRGPSRAGSKESTTGCGGGNRRQSSERRRLSRLRIVTSAAPSAKASPHQSAHPSPNHSPSKKPENFMVDQLNLAVGSEPQDNAEAIDWAKWRVDFRIELLDKLTDLYERLSEDSEGLRFFHREDAAELATALSLPEDWLQLRLDDATVKSLTRFIELASTLTSECVQECPESFWREEQLEAIDGVFKKHSRNEELAMSRLVQAVEEIPCGDLKVGRTKLELVVVAVTKSVVSYNRRTRRRSVLQTGHRLSYNEFLVVATKICQTCRSEQRKADYEKELALQKDTSFSVLELDDLRQLHRAYLSLERRADEDTYSRLHRLLRLCDASELTEGDIQALREVVNHHCAVDHRYASSSKVAFETFVRWMADIFEIGLAGLHRREAVVGGRSGFVAAILQEAQAKRQQQYDSEREARQQQQQLDGVSDLSSLAFNLMEKSRGGSRKPSRRNTLVNLQVPQARRASTVSFAAAAHRLVSKERSPFASNAASRLGSRQTSRQTSRESMDPDSGGLEAVQTGVFTIHGLPTSETMLQRKPGRATSRDLSHGGAARGSVLLNPLGISGKRRESVRVVTPMRLEDLPDMIQQALASPLLTPRRRQGGANAQPSLLEAGRSRTSPLARGPQMKPVQDPEAVVAAAIARLMTTS
eukprot:TRINITY_DN16576_c0_g1_i4.p1 TRINITY_DN16576_c0_g1~~TRINITY_DN16576_c0_g1_i4.p1  ORF type:complete len:703 (-),score=139.46 TRINITY_DN16576_c0_g1_i4:207-2315(-)